MTQVTLIRGYTETFYSMMICVCHRRHGRTDIVGQGHFYQAFTQKSELPLIDGTSSLGCIIEPPLVTKKGGFFFFVVVVFVEVCLPLKDSSTKRPAASIQHSLPEKNKTKKAYRSFTVKENQPSCWLKSKHAGTKTKRTKKK